MKRLTLLMALGVMSSVVLFGADPASAKAEETTKSKDRSKSTIVKVKSGDTLTSIAKKHKTTYVRLFNANKKIMNPDLINVGDKIRIPAKKEKLKDRLNQVAATTAAAPAASGYEYQPVAATSSYSYSGGNSSGNTYYQGYCTWYAKEKRPDLPNMLGNGGQWTANAAAQGFSTGSTARAGAIAETPGHVMYVEKVYGDGTMLISEMNGSAGFGNVGTRRVPTGGHSFIY